MKWENTLDKYWTGNKAIWLERGGVYGDRQKIRWLVDAFNNYILRVHYIHDKTLCTAVRINMQDSQSYYEEMSCL